MKNHRILRILALITILCTLLITIPIIPAQAAQFAINPTAGPAGTRVTLFGTGFSPAIQYEIYLGTTPLAEIIYPDSTGGITYSFLIPTGTAAGTYEVKLYTCASTPVSPCPTPFATVTTVTFTVTGTTTTTTTTTTPPQISISPNTGIPNTLITINGTGFSAQTNVRIYFNNVDTSTITTTSTTGTFTAQYAAPPKDPGTYVLRVDDDTAKSASASFQLTAELRANLSKNNGGVGLLERVSGIGFKPNATVTIKYDGKEISEAETNTDGTGSFTTSFKIPVSTGGAHKINISDGTHTKEYTFTVETTAPSAPVLQEPTSNAVLAEEVFFDWADVTDAQTGGSDPVTYSLQVTSDPSFAQSSLVVEKTGLKESRYALSNAERDKLTPPKPASEAEAKDKKYYWSVQVIDAASNKSEWSRAGSFIIPSPKAPAPAPAPTPTPTTPQKPAGEGTKLFGNFPSWAIYALAFLVALLMLIVGYWLGRKTSYY